MCKFLRVVGPSQLLQKPANEVSEETLDYLDASMLIICDLNICVISDFLFRVVFLVLSHRSS